MSVTIRPCHPISNRNSENDDEACSPKDWPNIDFLEQILGQEFKEGEPEPELAAASRNTTENDPTLLSPTTTPATTTTNATTTTTATNKNTKLILNGASLQASARWSLMKTLLVSATTDKNKEKDRVQRLVFFSQLDQCHDVGQSDDTRSTTTAAATFVFDPPKRHERQWTESEIQTIQKAWNHWVVERNPLSTSVGTSSSSSKNHTPTTSDLYELWPTEEEESNSATSPTSSSMGHHHHHHRRRSVLYSNQRPLQWNVMDCPPACKFQLHAHPNVELIFCVQGELHEVRMMGPPLPREAMIPISSTTTATATASSTTTDQEDENHSASRTTPVLQVSPLHYKWNQKSSSSTTSSSGNTSDNDQIHDSSSSSLGQPPQSSAPRQKPPPWKFSTLSTGNWLVNEVGSVHQSFTATSGTGCKLLVLWGGSHANVPRGEEPFIVRQAVEQMDQVIANQYSSSCACGGGSDNGGWERLEETFLPASERQRLSNDT
jgi:hypothetical protein